MAPTPFPSSSQATSEPCPCGSGDAYAGCCEPLHDRVAEAGTAEALMRSRYAAYALRREHHLFRTWHPRTRPATVTADPATRWTGLEVTSTSGGGAEDEDGVVAFRAAWSEEGGGSGELVERSRFVRHRGRWTYLDGNG